MSDVDISKIVKPGAKEILPGTVIVRGVSHGTTGVSVNTTKMDVDCGELLLPIFRKIVIQK